MAIDPSTAFVSYSREDLNFAHRLATDLRAKGAKVWMDKIDIRAGQRWEAEIEAAVGACSRVLVIPPRSRPRMSWRKSVWPLTTASK